MLQSLASLPSLTIDDYGSLKISYGDEGHSISLYSTQGASNTSAVLLDTGNFVLQELNSDGTVKQDLWQSFDYPTDTLLPGMKLGVNKITGHNWTLRSWRSVVVPDFGSFSFGMNKDPKPGKEFVILWHGEAYWTGGFSNEKGYQLWSTNGFTLPDQRGAYYSFVKITNENETYFNYSSNDAIFPRLRINHLGNLYLCERRHDYTFIKDSAHIVDGDVFEFNESDNLTRVDCQNRCLNNCSCVAYASSKQDDIGCKIWTRVPSIEMSQNAPTIYFLEYKAKPNRWWIWLIVAVGGIIIILLCSLYYAKQKKHKAEGEREKKQKMLIQELAGNAIPSTVDDEGKKQNNDGKNSHEFHVFSFESIYVATSNFSTENKLGEGGFGPVYKGKLPNGQEIAIKRLSKSSAQGLVEFKNEAILIAKLQHTNLVSLLGFCIQE
ncbi:hypothetical protein RGQ29_020971 [Quercus rubra]|uniref:Uncharacterized protein n=1 Tax=Quercus rubra TaxID=3512 RepID=A0AAN7FCK2_QUERU|nr:hypothetical protein RGQ29_020971 [Quercus rubra]